MQSLLHSAVAALTLTCVSAVNAGPVIYVDDSAPAGGDGASWNSAFRYLQDALAAATEGDEIRIGQGTYRPDLSDHGHAIPGDQSRAFDVPFPIQLFGGFAGVDAASPDDRDIQTFQTTLTGDIPGVDSATIAQVHATAAGTIIDGVSFTEAGYPNWIGGVALDIDSATTVIRNCRFEDNAHWSGCAITAYDCSIELTDCIFTNNKGRLRGGAIQLNQCDEVIISNCEFHRNGMSSANLNGGAIYGEEVGTLEIVDCRFENNEAATGGGIYVFDGVKVLIDRCEFNDNVAMLGGGGAVVTAERTQVTNCDFRQNYGAIVTGGLGVGGHEVGVVANCRFIGNVSAGLVGGCMPDGTTTIFNCIFSGNSGATAGGILSSDGPIINCTFFNNQGGAVAAGTRKSVVRNCILWNNSPEQVTTFLQNPVAYPTIEFSNVQDGWLGDGNVDADPLFAQPGTLNFRLGHGSVCLNAGNNGYLPSDILDLDNDGDFNEPLPVDYAYNPRVVDGTVDMGAFEGSFEVLPLAAIHEDFDPGEWVVLVPSGDDTADERTLSVRALNQSDVQNATILVTDLRDYAGDGGGAMLKIETTVPAGELLIRTKLPFNADGLGIAEATKSDLIRFDAVGSHWLLAAAKNTVINPEYNEPIGRRFVVINGSTAVPSIIHGDYGVYHNTLSGNGYVWANTDRGGEFCLRFERCPGDGAPYGCNGTINVHDLFGLIAKWGTDDRWFDTNGDFIVDGIDLTSLLSAWGVCDN